VLGDLSVTPDDRVLVDFRTADDAGVYRLDAGRALVQTVDFFTPIVDDPRTYGRIAAANALSDIYAMGGRPLTALAIAGFPKDADNAVLATIFRGGIETLAEAGVALLGGHTVQDAEIKFGYAVTGEIDPARIRSNGGARSGDALILTKPLGTGVIATAIKFNRAPAAAVDAAVASMTALNRGAAEAMAGVDDVHACTDITGFGLIFDVASVPLLPGALDLVDRNTPGGGRTNLEHFGGGVVQSGPADPRRVQLLYDPQTSGGLLIAVAAEHVGELQRRLQGHGAGGWLIGTVAAGDGAPIQLR
jgi:selenide,water dikinase